MERETFLEVAGDGPEEHEQKCTICLVSPATFRFIVIWRG